MSLLGNKKKLLNNETYKRVTVTNDKTPIQLAEMQCLRKELKTREAKSERDITIKYKKAFHLSILELLH